MNNKGLWAEKIAGEYLENLGYSPLFSNYGWKYGEIDLIMKDKDFLVFIEVRSLTSDKDIIPAETITAKKIKKIKKTAEFFLHKNKLYETPCRFDFIAIQGTPEDFILEHYINSF